MDGRIEATTSCPGNRREGKSLADVTLATFLYASGERILRGNMESRTDIRIDEGGQWWTSDSPIRNEAVLAYFKANLHRTEDDRYFIVNRLRGQMELAWLERVDGFPLLASRCVLRPTQGIVQLRVEGRGMQSIPCTEFRTDGLSTLWVMLSSPQTEGDLPREAPVPVRLTANAMSDLRDFLDQSESGDWELACTRIERSPSPFPSNR